MHKINKKPIALEVLIGQKDYYLIYNMDD